MKIYFLIVLIISSISASENGNNNYLKNNICGIGQHKCDSCNAIPNSFCDERIEAVYYENFPSSEEEENQELNEFLKYFKA